jgi:hypothetical protein
MRLSTLLLLAACAAENPVAPKLETEPVCIFDAASMPSLGQQGRFGFGYFPAASQSLDWPVAAGGAHTNVLALSSVEVAMVDSVRSSDASIAKFNLASIGGSSCQHQALITVHSGRPGSADLILADADGNEVDRVRVRVAPTAALLFDRGWDGGTPTALAGSLQGLHVTTLGADGGVLVGTGAVRFSLSGTLAVFPDDEVQPPWWGGDETTFTGGPGAGVVSADADGGHLSVAINFVDEMELTHFALRSVRGDKPLTRDVFVSAAAGEVQLYGAQCDWRWPGGTPPLWIDGGWIGAGAATHYRFTSDRPGRYSALCVLPGGTSQSIELAFEDPASELTARSSR